MITHETFVAEIAFLFAVQQMARLICMKRIGSTKPRFPEAMVRSAGALWPDPIATRCQMRRSRIGIAGRDVLECARLPTRGVDAVQDAPESAR